MPRKKEPQPDPLEIIEYPDNLTIEVRDEFTAEIGSGKHKKAEADRMFELALKEIADNYFFATEATQSKIKRACITHTSLGRELEKRGFPGSSRTLRRLAKRVLLNIKLLEKYRKN